MALFEGDAVHVESDGSLTVVPTCPTCGSELADMRGVGMNAQKVAREGTCFLWADDQYMCAQAQRMRDIR